MKAVVIAAGIRPETEALQERFPSPLLPSIDRPFLQRVIEWIVARGIDELHVVVSHRPEKVEDLLGDGSRWGCRVNWHLSRDPGHPYDVLSRLAASDESEPLLLAQGDCLPLIKTGDGLPHEPTLFCGPLTEDGEDLLVRWTGWGVLSPWMLTGLERFDEAGVGRHLADAGCTQVPVGQILSVRSFEDLLSSQRELLSGEAVDQLLGGREVEPGVWISRNVMLHPTVSVKPPVFIGENSRINKGARIGPNVVVGHDCIIDERSILVDSAVFPNSFVGKHLELDRTVVDRNRMVNVRYGAVVDVADDFILGNMGHGYLGSLLGRFWSRGVALLLLLLLSPVMLAVVTVLKLFRRGPVLHRTGVVRLPAAPERSGWRLFEHLSFVPRTAVRSGGGPGHFCLDVLPALINIARGEMRFVGLPPRTPEEIEELSPDWRELYLRSSAGLVTEAFIHYGASADEDELFTAEAMYSASRNLWHDLALISGYLRRLVIAR